MSDQITIKEYMERRYNGPTMHSERCICYNCLYWWSDRCPYGKCYDDHRASEDPYDAAHPEELPRTMWTDWNKPGEQAHWCRGGIFYPTYYCEHFQKYQGQRVEHCLNAAVSIFQDGYIYCSIVDSIGCQECYKRFETEKGEKTWLKIL